MSEAIPESIPTSSDPKSRRPTKKLRGPATATTLQAHAVQNIFEKFTDKEMMLPPSSSTKQRSLPAPPEIVANVQGSSAGAGSGEFHVYKASRRREYERIRMMDEESKAEEADRLFKEKQEDNRRKDEEKRSKNAQRRAKKKAAKERHVKDTAVEDKVESRARKAAVGEGLPAEERIELNDAD